MAGDDFNMSLRKFLKQVGVTSQSEIEKAVRAAKASGALNDGHVTATMTLTIEAVDLSHEVVADIAVSDA